jgi:hypothetical protein
MKQIRACGLGEGLTAHQNGTRGKAILVAQEKDGMASSGIIYREVGFDERIHHTIDQSHNFISYI